MLKRFATITLTAAAIAGLTAAPTKAAEKVTVCALTFVSSSPLFIAADKGYYKAAGLDVTFRFFRAATPVAVGVA
jgi:NitT/TauT family transport system substrate-binding protein